MLTETVKGLQAQAEWAKAGFEGVNNEKKAILRKVPKGERRAYLKNVGADYYVSFYLDSNDEVLPDEDWHGDPD